MDLIRDHRYTIKEISEASGISVTTLYCRKRSMGIPMTREGLTYEDALRLIEGNRSHQCSRAPDSRRIAELKLRLRNDGRGYKGGQKG